MILLRIMCADAARLKSTRLKIYYMFECLLEDSHASPRTAQHRQSGIDRSGEVEVQVCDIQSYTSES